MQHGTSAPGEAPGRLRRRDLVLLCAAAVALQTIVWMVILSIVARYVAMYRGGATTPDLEHYALVADYVRHGWWPYVQFRFEYPPLALIPILAPPAASSVARYGAEFRAVMVVLYAATAVVTTLAAARIWPTLGRPLGAALALAFGVAAIGLTALNRYDGTVALIVAATLLCLICRRWAWAGLFVGLGFSLKLMPVVLLPLALTLVRTWRRAALVVALAAAGAILPFVPFLVRGAGGVWTSLFAGQAGRGAGIESLMATPYLLAQVAGLGHVTVVQVPGGSTELSAPGMAVLVAAAPLLVFVLLAILYAVAWRARHALRDDAEGIVVVALAAILASICGNKLISPQHVIWLLPLAALGVVSMRVSYRVPAVLVLVAAVFTQAEYPFLYDNMVGLHVAGVLAVSIRNGLLVAAYVAALVVVWRRVAEPVPGLAPALGTAAEPAAAESPAAQPLTGS
ncbi:MAG TPA: glycosyltransferase family 87 protein [Thermoleophilia bacterium]|nr:glycosyltransferase family 87 protein [Thermoleophilia bacterium]